MSHLWTVDSNDMKGINECYAPSTIQTFWNGSFKLPIMDMEIGYSNTFGDLPGLEGVIEQSAVVKLVSYGRTQRPRTSRKRIPYLMLLAPDRLVLYSAAEGKHDDVMEIHRDISGFGVEETEGTKVKQTASKKVISLTASTEFDSSITPFSVSKDCKSDSEEEEEEEEEELIDGQEFRMGVSMNQIIDVHVVNENDMCVVYHPNKVSKKWACDEEMSSYPSSLVRSLVTRMSFNSNMKSEPRDIFSKHPNSHFFIIRFQNSTRDEVYGFQQSLHHTKRRFQECMAWMSKQLPLRQESRIFMVTSGRQGSQQGNFCHTFPDLGESIRLPRDIGKAMADSGSDEYLNTTITVYLDTPIGASYGYISLMDVERSFVEGSAPIDIIANIQDTPQAPDNFSWQVSLQFRAERTQTGQKIPKQGRSNHPKKGQMSVKRKQSLGLGLPILISLAALKTGAAVARQCKPKQSRLKTPRAVIFDWSISVLSIDITLEPVGRVRGAVSRMMSTSAVSEGTLLQDTNLLPPAFEHLMNKYPDIIEYDTAKRFIVGLDVESKAYHGLLKMVEFWTSHRLDLILTCRQPAFESMKKHYPHGLIGWSSKSDCLIEFEAMGKWPDAYKAIIGEGFDEEAILQHLLFCYMFTFKRIDNRPWPKGKTVKIMDIDGLQMSHLGQPGFKFITNIANVLSIMFPQRLQKCIFVNCPSWWSMAWRIMSPMIPEKVRSQMQMFGKNNSDKARVALLEWIDEESLPTKYGGKNESFFSEYEQMLVDHARTLNAGA